MLIRGDARALPLADACVQCVVTSPPYYGLRDYGVAGQIGLEPTPDAYVATLVDVFREVRRVLKPDGVVWINLGDSYAQSGMGGDPAESAFRKQATNVGSLIQGRHACNGSKPKDLLGIPWRVAFALQADGWVLRQEIIWAKPNPMPESVTDRCTKAHEQLFLFSKAKWSGPLPCRFADISDDDARWIALCIDTEGCIVVKRVKQTDGGADAFGPQVTFGGTNRALVERFRQIVGHGNIATRSGKNAPMFYWQIGNNLARDLLHRIYPFLIVKQRQARIAIYVDDLVYYRGGKLPSRKQRTAAENNRLLSLWARNKQCNQFGDPDLSDVPEPIYGRWSDCERYYYDQQAIREEPTGRTDPITSFGTPKERQDNGRSYALAGMIGRNKRSVWEIATQPYSEAHFATFPPALIEPCILAGTSEKGCCSKCGAPWVRQLERINQSASIAGPKTQAKQKQGLVTAFSGYADGSTAPLLRTIGWAPSCRCDAGVVPAVVLDPFGGAGTTGLVADRLQRNAILIELNPTYAELARKRISGDAPLFAMLEREQETAPEAETELRLDI